MTMQFGMMRWARRHEAATWVLGGQAGVKGCVISIFVCLALSGCDKMADSKTFIERGLRSSQFDTRPVPLKIGDTYLAIPRNYIDSFDRTGKDGTFIKTTGVLLFAHWPTMEGRTPANRDEIYSVESRNGYHSVDIMIDGINGLRYPNDDDEFEFTYRGRTVGYPNEKDPRGSITRDGSFYGYERYIRKNDWRFAFDHGPTALILRKLDQRDRLTSYVYCDSHEIEKSHDYKPQEYYRRRSGCDLYVHHRQFQIKSHFLEENRLAEVAKLEAAIRRKVDEFIAEGEAIHRQGAQAK